MPNPLPADTYALIKVYYRYTLCTAAEIAEYVGVEKSTVNKYINRCDSFSPLFKMKREELVTKRVRPIKSYERGYRRIQRPSWFTGGSDGNCVLEHQVVWCAVHNVTQVPTGYIVHHKDGDKLNNSPSNLELLHRREHAKHHHDLGDTL